MMYRKRWRWRAALLPLAAALAALGQTQSGSPNVGLEQGIPGSLACDDRYEICVDSSGRPLTTSSSQGTQGLETPSGGYSGAEPHYEFGNGVPIDMSSRDARRPVPGQSATSAPIRFRPEPLTEFQKFVAADTGKILPIFGAQLFRDVPATFAPLDRVPVPANYVVGPGDGLLLRAWGSITFYMRVTVDRDGNIYIPHIGTLPIAGIRYAELRDYLSAQISTSFKKFELNVEMEQLRAIQVFVVGRTRRPGSYTISSLSSLVDALFVSGGPSSTGSMRRIEVKRGGSVVTELDLYSFLLDGDKSKDINLVPGDIIYDPPAGPRVALIGSVSQPAIYEFRKGETVGDILRMAGGLTSLAMQGSAELERVDASGSRHVIEVHFDEAGLKTPLADGDILRSLSIVPKFDNAVTLRGNVANPGRFPWHAGMRVRDLIPNKDVLLTRNYWQQKNGLVSIAEPEPSEAADDQSSAAQRDGRAAGRGDDAGNSATAVPVNKLPETAGPDAKANPDAKADSDTAAKGSSGRGGSLGTQNGAPSVQFPVTNRVTKRVPDIDWDYAVVERLNSTDLSPSLEPFNLGHALESSGGKDDLELQPGDVVTIFSQADIHVPQRSQKAFVRLEGEFKSAGVYSVRAGETLRDLIQRAGGLTPEAYLYGSSFARESTRREQQAQLDEYTDDLERDIERASSSRSTSAVSPQEAATISATLDSQRTLVAKLRLMRASGRIVLDITPGSTGLETIPDLPLEDGDSFVVPAKPSNVKVVGAVYDQNAFLFKSARKAGDYLQLAGGISRSGDSHHTFIIRADGSVVSRKSKSARGGLERLAMNPGDTLVVPENLEKVTLLRGLTDWSAVLGNFGLGAAAINVLR
jgi:polysaccharide export outer membrane protein